MRRVRPTFVMVPSLSFRAPPGHGRWRLCARAAADLQVSSLQNSRVKAARALLRRRQREKESRILLEGHRLVSDALDSGLVPHTLFYTPEALERAPSGSHLRKLVNICGEQAIVVSEQVIHSMSDTVSPQGIVAILDRPRLPIPSRSSLFLICDRVGDPGNVGTLLRAAAGAGVDAVYMTPGCADVWGLKALRSGMGAQFRIPIITSASWPDILGGLQLFGCELRVASGSSPHSYADADWTIPSALLVGAEADGPSASALEAAHSFVAIPLAQHVESLNAAVAGAVILFEASRQRAALL